MQIVLATHNRGKMEEMVQILDHLSVELLTLDAFPIIGDIPETGSTLKENAFIKAETVHKITGLPALADDTGLEVDALNGAPGVYSARYAGENATFEDNCNKMLSELDGLPMAERSARFRTVIAFVTGDQNEWTEGMVEGAILNHKEGDGGFGFDSIFYYPPLKKTFASLEKEEKNSVSHRGKALRNFSVILDPYTAKGVRPSMTSQRIGIPTLHSSIIQINSIFIRWLCLMILPPISRGISSDYHSLLCEKLR